MTSWLSDSLSVVKARLFCAALLLSAPAHAEGPPPPPAAAQQPLAESTTLPSSRAREPLPEADTIKVRIDGEYELRQSYLTALPLARIDDSASLAQTSRLFHWLRLRPLVLFGKRWVLRAEADAPRGMIYGQEPSGIVDSGSDFEEQQLMRVQPRRLSLQLRGHVGELTLGHMPTRLGMGLLDDDGDQPRWFGTPDRPATFERLELTSGASEAELRVGVAADALFDDGRLSLVDGDEQLRLALTARYAPNERVHLALLARYETLRARGARGGAQAFVFDVSGGFRAAIPGHPGELFGEYEGVYRIGDVNEPTAFAATGGERSLTALAAATRVGLSLDRSENYRRFAYLVASIEWGMASGDADPSDDELHRFVMNPNHGVGLLLFSELLRFKTSRAQALLGRADAAAGSARVEGLATRGGVAGASYLNPVLLVRPMADLSLKVGAVVASASTNVVDPSALLASGSRQNFDGGSSLGRSLGTELDVGGEIKIPLEPPLELRLSVEAGVAFPGSAFDDAEGNGLGTQAITTGGLGLTF